MMRGGKLDRVITIEAYAPGAPDGYGNSVPVWTPLTTTRAELVQSSAEEYLRGYGEGENAVLIFRIRYLDGITTAHRVGFDSRQLNIREVKEIGRRAGLELRCEEVRS